VVGSVGTLGVFSAIGFRLEPVPAERVMLAAFFRDLVEPAEAVPHLKPLGPSLLELMDGFGARLLKKDAGLSVPDGAGSVLLVEFDENAKSMAVEAETVFADRALSWHVIEDHYRQKALWQVRASMLFTIKKQNETREKRYLSFVDDLAVPVSALPAFIEEIRAVFDTRDIPVVIYGHVGEGNLHVRPLIAEEGWRGNVREIAKECFDTVMRYNGSMAAEHGAGRNRSEFVQREWGQELVGIMQAAKSLFDPEGLMNPGFLFSESDFTKGFRF
jgi:FAD/FMN-containing dehydrogenase